MESNVKFHIQHLRTDIENKRWQSPYRLVVGKKRKKGGESYPPNPLVTFDEDKCQVQYNSSIILTGYKDPASNIWTLPVLPVGAPQTTLNATHQSSLSPCLSDAPQHTANFSYHRTTKENNMKFKHQSLCNLPKLLLLAAICHGFLHGAPHLSKMAVTNYLPPSPAMSKGHMK